MEGSEVGEGSIEEGTGAVILDIDVKGQCCSYDPNLGLKTNLKKEKEKNKS